AGVPDRPEVVERPFLAEGPQIEMQHLGELEDLLAVLLEDPVEPYGLPAERRVVEDERVGLDVAHLPRFLEHLDPLLDARRFRRLVRIVGCRGTQEGRTEREERGHRRRRAGGGRSARHEAAFIASTLRRYWPVCEPVASAVSATCS